MENYITLEKICEGTYGIMYKGQDKRDGKVVALKKIHFEGEYEGVPQTVLREIALLRQLYHKNIVRLEDVQFESYKIVYLVFEHVSMDLKQYLDSIPKNEKLETKLTKSYLHQILEAITFCHMRCILHRDLKPQNLLIDEKGTIKVADFGLGRAIGIPLRACTTEVELLWYRAPEILLGSRQYSTPVDVWSIGCVFAEMVTRKPLFRGDSEIGQLFKIFRVLGTPTSNTWPEVALHPNFKPIFPSWKANILVSAVPDLDNEALELLGKMLTLNPGKRICAKDGLRHPYFH